MVGALRVVEFKRLLNLAKADKCQDDASGPETSKRWVVWQKGNLARPLRQLGDGAEGCAKLAAPNQEEQRWALINGLTLEDEERSAVL